MIQLEREAEIRAGIHHGKSIFIAIYVSKINNYERPLNLWS
jgi:hypothetical protein